MFDYRLDHVDMYIDHGAGTRSTVLRRRGDEAIDLFMDDGCDGREGLGRDDLIAVMKDHIDERFVRHHEWQESVAREKWDGDA